MQDVYTNLNTAAIKSVVVTLVANHLGLCLHQKDVRFCTKEHALYLCGVLIVRTDRYLHHPKASQHAYANFEFLTTVDQVLDSLKRHNISSKKRPTFSPNLRHLLQAAQNRSRFAVNCYNERVTPLQLLKTL